MAAFAELLVDVVTWCRYDDYMNVGIRELKAHLSEYVGKAANGEQFTVTDRGKPVARLAGLDGLSALDRGIEEGWITPPTRNRLEPVVRCASSRRIADVLDEDRG